MDRVAITDRTKNGSTRVLDGPSKQSIPADPGARGTPAVRSAGVEPVLPGTTETFADTPHAEAEVTLQQLWFELPVPDRQRFGHCFSGMVLKALGLRSCHSEEVRA
jgi:hypothetical protein